MLPFSDPSFSFFFPQPSPLLSPLDGSVEGDVDRAPNPRTRSERSRSGRAPRWGVSSPAPRRSTSPSRPPFSDAAGSSVAGESGSDASRVRWDLVRRVRGEIARGTYETEERWQVVADRLLRELGQ